MPGDPDEEPLDWILADGQTESMAEAAYRFAAFTEGVTTVMMGTLSTERLEQNIRSVKKGPLPREVVERLHAMFGRVAEPIGN